MANLNKRIPDNTEGNYFVDSTCINCDVCRKIAPNHYGDNGNYSFVSKQPEEETEKLLVQQALLACPVGSIGMQENENLLQARQCFPEKIENNIFYNGYTSRNSYGGDSYFIQSPQGNWMIDSPRFNKDLINKFHEMGGLKYIFLSHRDDVADADKYAKEFGAKRIIHREDLSAQPDSEIVLEGDCHFNQDKAEIIFTPGHSQGHCVLIWDKKYLFTGDHLAYSRKLKSLYAFRNYCWYSWEKQIKSMEKLKAYPDIEWVLPGHGMRTQIEKGSFVKKIDAVIDWMN